MSVAGVASTGAGRALWSEDTMRAEGGLQLLEVVCFQGEARRLAAGLLTQVCFLMKEGEVVFLVTKSFTCRRRGGTPRDGAVFFY